MTPRVRRLRRANTSRSGLFGILLGALLFFPGPFVRAALPPLLPPQADRTGLPPRCRARTKLGPTSPLPQSCGHRGPVWLSNSATGRAGLSPPPLPVSGGLTLDIEPPRSDQCRIVSLVSTYPSGRSPIFLDRPTVRVGAKCCDVFGLQNKTIAKWSATYRRI